MSRESSIRYDRLVSAQIRNAGMAFLAAGALGGFAAGEATDSLKVGVATGLSFELAGIAVTRLTKARHLSSVRASIGESDLNIEAINDSTDRIVGAIRRGPLPPADQAPP